MRWFCIYVQVFFRLCIYSQFSARDSCVLVAKVAALYKDAIIGQLSAIGNNIQFDRSVSKGDSNQQINGGSDQ